MIARLLVAGAEEGTLDIPIEKGPFKSRISIHLSQTRIEGEEICIPIEGKLTGSRDLIFSRIQGRQGMIWFAPRADGGVVGSIMTQLVRLAIKRVGHKFEDRERGSGSFADHVHFEDSRIGIRVDAFIEKRGFTLRDLRVRNELFFTVAPIETPEEPQLPMGESETTIINIAPNFLRAIGEDKVVAEETPLGPVTVLGTRLQILGNALLLPIKLAEETFVLRVTIEHSELNLQLFGGD